MWAHNLLELVNSANQIPDRRGLECETYCLGSTTRGRNLLAAISNYNCHYFSTGEPTYWPTDPNKLPDLLDFLVTRGLPATDIQVVPVFELSSDHSPIIASFGASLTNKAVTPTLATIHANWDMFRAYIDEHIVYNRLRRKLQTALRNVNNDTFAHYLTSLSPNDTLWKATKRLRRPQVLIPSFRNADGSWAKSNDEKAKTFAVHLQRVFTPHHFLNPTDAAIPAFLDVPWQMSLPIKPSSPKEVVEAIAHINVRKAPGYDLISGKVLKELPKKATTSHYPL